MIVPAQIVIGGITVLTDLNPWVVSFHLLVSMLIVQLCVWLVREVADWSPTATNRDPDLRFVTNQRVRRLAWLVFASGWLVLYLGTVVTGSGPHAGDGDARRTGLDPQVFSHVHAASVYLLVALTLGLLVWAGTQGTPGLVRAAGALLAVELAQGAIGFTQYFLDLPVTLVALHMLGAALTAAALAWVVLASREKAAVASRSNRINVTTAGPHPRARANRRSFPQTSRWTIWLPLGHRFPAKGPNVVGNDPNCPVLDRGPVQPSGESADQRVERDRDEQQRQVEVGAVEEPHRLDHRQ